MSPNFCFKSQSNIKMDFSHAKGVMVYRFP